MIALMLGAARPPPDAGPGQAYYHGLALSESASQTHSAEEFAEGGHGQVFGADPDL